MRASAAVGLLLASSMSIFGLYGRQQQNAAYPPGPEPVWVNGQMGVYNPDTGVFVPSTSPLFDQTCDLIQRRRQQAAGGSASSWGYGHHWHYYPSLHMFSYPSGGASGMRSSSGFSSFHSSSMRGGLGSTGHSFGASHS